MNTETSKNLRIDIQNAIDSIVRFHGDSISNSTLQFHWALTGMIGELYVAQYLLPDSETGFSLKQKRNSYDLKAFGKKFEVKTTMKDERKTEIGFDYINPSKFDILVLVYLYSDLSVKKMKWFSKKLVKELFLPRVIAWKNIEKIKEEDLTKNYWIAYKQFSENEGIKARIKQVDEKFPQRGRSFLQRYEELVNAILKPDMNFNPDLDYLFQ